MHLRSNQAGKPVQVMCWIEENTLKCYSNEHKSPKSKLLEIWTLLVFLSLEFFPFFFPVNQDLVKYSLQCFDEIPLCRKTHLITISCWRLSLNSSIPWSCTLWHLQEYLSPLYLFFWEFNSMNLLILECAKPGSRAGCHQMCGYCLTCSGNLHL